MKAKFKKGGYSAETANQYISASKPVYSLNKELDPQFKFENNKLTDTIESYKAWFSQEGLEPFSVKFLTKITLPPYLSAIEFINLEACEVNYDVYFRAEDITQ